MASRFRLIVKSNVLVVKKHHALAGPWWQRCSMARIRNTASWAKRHCLTQVSALMQAAVSSGLGENTFEVRRLCPLNQTPSG